MARLTNLIANDRERERGDTVRWLRALATSIKKEWRTAPSGYEAAALGGEWRALKDAADRIARGDHVCAEPVESWEGRE